MQSDNLRMEKCKVGSAKWEVQIEENLDRLSTTHADRLMTLMTLNFQQFEHVSLMAAWVVPTLVGTTIGVSSFFHGTEREIRARCERLESGSPSSNAWPARPPHARPRHNTSST